MTKTNVFAFLIFALTLFSCRQENRSESSSSDESSAFSSLEISSVTFEIDIARCYWDIPDTPGPAYLWGMCSFPAFLADHIDTKSLVVGDALTVTFFGEYRIVDIYPSLFRIDPARFISAEIKKAKVLEVSVTEGQVVAPEGVSLDKMAVGLPPDKAVGDGYQYVATDQLEKGYITCSALDEREARAIYSFDPRSATQDPPVFWDK